MTTLQYSENYLVTTTYPGFSGVTKQSAIRRLLFLLPDLILNSLSPNYSASQKEHHGLKGKLWAEIMYHF